MESETELDGQRRKRVVIKVMGDEGPLGGV
jgi:hypothetical protein